MAEVTGTIGNENVALNNAATEATLRLLLQSSLATTKEQKAAIAQIAQRSGLDPTAIAAVNQGFQQTTPSVGALGKAAIGAGAAFAGIQSSAKPFIDLGEKLASGNAQASDVFSTFSKLGGPIGLAASGFSKLAQFQEQMLGQYQGMTNAGANFGGSLTDLRMAASGTYMTMDEFGKIVKANGSSFAKMGGSVDEGARAWAKASNTLLSSEAGTNLRALGYTTEQVNQGMLDYISVTGGRSKKELQNTDALAKSSALYMQELDELASITGKSREEIAKKSKAELEAADFQIFLAGKSKEEREVIEANVKRAGALYGQGGMDIAKANAMGVAVQGEAGKKLTALSSQTSDGIKKDLEIRKQYGNDSKLIGKNEAETRNATVENLKKFAGAQASFGGVTKGVEDAFLQSAKDQQLGRQGVEDQYGELAKERADREKSQAADAVKTQESLQKLGQSIMALVTPILNFFLPIMNGIIGTMVKYKEVTLALIAAYVLWKGTMAAKTALGGLGSGGGAAGGLGGIIPGAGGPKVPTPGPGEAGGMGGVAEGIGKLGPAMSSIGKGAGDLIKSFMQGIAGGLRAFSNPMVLAGAAGFGVAIAAIGAGIAAASWLMGKALPTLAEGLGKIGELDGDRLGGAAMGIGKVGLSLLAFGPFAVFGLPAAFAVDKLGDGLVKLNSVDPIKLEKIAGAMEKIKQATPSATDIIKMGMMAAVGGLTKLVGGGDKPAEAPAKTTPTATAAKPRESNNILVELQRLNKQTEDVLKILKETADHTKQGVSATKSLGGNLFSF